MHVLTRITINEQARGELLDRTPHIEAVRTDLWLVLVPVRWLA